MPPKTVGVARHRKGGQQVRIGLGWVKLYLKGNHKLKIQIFVQTCY